MFGRRSPGGSAQSPGSLSDGMGMPVEGEQSPTMARSSSWLHFWKASTPPESVASSRNNSAHGGNVFGNLSDDAKPMQRSNSFMWNWSKYRADDPVSSPASPGSSSHGANQFSVDANGDQVPCEIKPAITPPRAMMRNLSMGSFRTLHRPTPPTHAPKPVAIPRLSAEHRRAQARAAIDPCIDLSRPGRMHRPQSPWTHA